MIMRKILMMMIAFGLAAVLFAERTEDGMARITLDEEGIPGYVFFEGFDIIHKKNWRKIIIKNDFFNGAILG